MLLAAGRGVRMRPLTDTCPKPLLMVRGKPLMQWHLQALAHGGLGHVVVNTDWLGAQIADRFGSTFSLQPLSGKHEQLSIVEHLRISYSHEGNDFGHALETAGGIVRALPMLDEVFWVLAGDVFVPDFAFSQAMVERFRASGMLAHLWLVPNPEHHPQGDFGLEINLDTGNALALNLPQQDPRPRYTYSTIGLYRQALFLPPWCPIPLGNPSGEIAALGPLLRSAMDQHRVSAQRFEGAWTDVGSPQRLAELNLESGLPS